MCVVGRQDVCSLARQDVCSLERQDVCFLERQDVLAWPGLSWLGLACHNSKK